VHFGERALRFGVSSALPFAIGACSLLLDNDPTQCRTTADCVARGPAFAHSFCDDHHACETTCTTNEECTMVNGGERSLCRITDHQCAKLLSVDCQTLLADAPDLDDQATWLGMLLPLNAETLSLSQSKENATDLALRDFRVASGGLPPVHAGEAHRRLAFVVCDHAADPERAARHLALDLGVPAIVGPIYSGDLIRVATDVTIPNQVLLISPAATSPFITNLANKNGLVWRTAPSDSVQSVAIARLLALRVEPALRVDVLDRDELLRVAVVHKGDAYGIGLAGALYDQLVFNGRSAQENSGNYKVIDYGDLSDPDNLPTPQRYAAAIDELVAFTPHVVIIAGTTEGITDIFTPLEARWPAAGRFRPRYVMTDGLQPRPQLLAAVGSDAELRHRILGTAPGTSSPLYQKFLGRYGSVFQDGTQPSQATAATYDAVYLLSYAIASLGAEPLSGPRVNEGLMRMVPPGARIDVGPENINDALTRLEAGQPIDFNGASGPLDFDVSTGEAEADVQVWCLDVDAKGVAVEFKDSGLFYDATRKALSGEMSCP
jgi:branched-chain amino acid transport system substrate-binding protein